MAKLNAQETDVLPEKCRIMTRKLDSVKPHPDNPRIHTEKQIEKLMQSIRQRGDAKVSISFQKSTGYILTGHANWEAKKRLGLSSSKMVECDFTDAEAMAWMLDDNHLGDMSMFDMPKLNADIALLKDMDYKMEDLSWEMGEINAGNISGEPQNPWELWEEMPEFEQENAIFRMIRIYFQTSDDVDKFAKLMEQNITDKTTYIWFPKIEKIKMSDYICVDDES